MSSNNNSGKGGLNAGSLVVASLTVLFVAFKLAGVGQVANWSWFWVLSPVWIPITFLFLILFVAGLIWVIASIRLHIVKRKGHRLTRNNKKA